MNYADYYSPPAYHPPKSQLGMPGLRPGFNPYNYSQNTQANGIYSGANGQMQMTSMHNSTGLQAPQYQPPAAGKIGYGVPGAGGHGPGLGVAPQKKVRPWWMSQQQWDAMQNPPTYPQAVLLRQPYQNGSPFADGGSNNPYAQMRLY